VPHKPWENIDLIKPPKTQRLPDIVNIEEAKRLFMAILTLSYRVFYFTVYGLGLRLGEGLRLQRGILTPIVGASISAIPRAIKTVSFLIHYS
jgi:hypothetical protein